HLDRIAALVDVQELVVDALFAAKVLGDGNACDRFLNAGVDIGNRLLAAAGDAARPLLEAPRNEKAQRRKEAEKHGQLPVDADQIDQENGNQEELSHNFCDQD